MLSGTFKFTDLTSRLRKTFSGFCKDQSGATAIEYGMIGAVVSIVILGILLILRTTLRDDIYGKISDAVVSGLSGS